VPFARPRNTSEKITAAHDSRSDAKLTAYHF
jgi:hypothetical protein